MKKKITRLFTAVMAGLMLVSCGSSDEVSPSAEAQPQASEAEAASEKAPAPDAEETTSEWPVIGSADAPIEVKILIKDVLPDEEDVIAMAEVVEEKMAAHGQHIKLIIVEPPAGSYATALPLAVRTGDVDADIIYFQGGGDLQISQEGFLEDLTTYIQGSTYVKELMLPVNNARIANYPYLLWLAPARVSTPVMRAGWAEQLDSYDELIANPTVDNYYAMFKEMKEKGMVEYAVTADDSNNQGEGNLVRLNNIFNQAFGVTSTLVKTEEGWVFSRTTEAEKNKLEFYAKLYSEGLLDPEYLTNTWDVMEQKFYEGKAGIIVGTAGSVIQVYNNKLEALGDSSLVVLPPATGVSQGFKAVDVTKEDRGFAINIDSPNKDAAWAFLEFMASPEGRIIDKCGIEGKHYNVENGKIMFTEAYPEWWSRIWETTNKFEPETPLAQPIYVEAAQNSLDLANQYYVEDINVLVPEELAPQWDAMKLIYDEYASDIVRGIKPISAFDEFVEKWNEAGGTAFSQYLDGVLE